MEASTLRTVFAVAVAGVVLVLWGTMVIQRREAGLQHLERFTREPDHGFDTRRFHLYRWVWGRQTRTLTVGGSMIALGLAAGVIWWFHS